MLDQGPNISSDYYLNLPFQANVVCRQLGFPNATNFTIGSYFGSVTPRYKMQNISTYFDGDLPAQGLGN